MKAFVLKRRADQTVVVVFMIALFALGVAGSLLGGLAATDASQFWQNFVGGIALLALMTLPVWFLQRWQAIVRPSLVRERQQQVRRIRLVLIVVWLAGLGIAAFALALNVSRSASIEANVAVGLLIAYLLGWGWLVFRVLGRLPLPLGRLRARLLGARTK